MRALGLAGSMAAAEAQASGHMELSPSPIAEAFGLGTPTGPLVAITSGPSAVHRSWRLSTSQGRFAVKAFNRDPHARGVEALEGPVRLELAAMAAGVPLPRPCLAVATGASVAEVPAPGPQSVLVRVHEWLNERAPQPQPSGRPGGALAGGVRGHRCAERAPAAAGQTGPVDRAAGLTTRTRLVTQRPDFLPAPPAVETAAGRRRARPHQVLLVAGRRGDNVA
jgi:hypothetical protein